MQTSAAPRAASAAAHTGLDAGGSEFLGFKPGQEACGVDIDRPMSGAQMGPMDQQAASPCPSRAGARMHQAAS